MAEVTAREDIEAGGVGDRPSSELLSGCPEACSK